MPNEPLSTQNYVQIGDKVLNRTADASVTTNDVSLSDRVFVFKKNEDGSIKTVVNTTIQYIVDAFSQDATAIKASCNQIKADTSQLKADTEALKNAAVTAKTSAESARDSAISAKNSASSSATNASSSETLARKWASNPVDAVVADSKYSAYHYSVKAGASATSASTSANTATTKASEASASASSASTSATNASSSASSASASATTATTKASEASTSANQAKGYRDEAQAFRDEVNPTLIKQTILDTIYPIGSIYMSTNSTDPGSFLGGSWAPIKDRFLLAAGDKYAAGSEDGSAMHSHTTAVHTLTVDEMPSHTHMLNINSDNSEPFLPNGNINTLSVINNMGAFSKNGVICDRNPAVISARTINTYTGGSASHSHGITGASSSMPPYLTVYVWKRIPPQN